MLKMSPARQKVLHLITHLDVGGAQDNTLLTVEHLDRTRYEVHLASAPAGEWEDRGRQVADSFWPIAHLAREVRPVWDVRALTEIAALLRRGQYDVVHTHSSKAGFLGRVAARITGVPIIVHTVHGFPFHDYMSPLHHHLYLLLERWAARISDRLIMVSELNRREAIRLGIAPADRMVTIYSGIDLQAFGRPVDAHRVRKELGLDPSQPVVGTVGRLAEQKAPQLFVEAARLVLEQRPETQFVLVGDGPLRPEVEALIGAEPRIRLLGNRADVPAILGALDIFVLASLWEGLGRALTEAMAAGRPVVVTAVDGVPELVEDGQTGYLVPPRRPDRLADGILRLLDHADVRERLGAQARARVIPQFDLKHMLDGIAALYDGLSQAAQVPATLSRQSHAR